MSDVLGYVPLNDESLDGLTWRQDFGGAVSNNPGFEVGIIPSPSYTYPDSKPFVAPPNVKVYDCVLGPGCLYEFPPGDTFPGPTCVQGYNCPGDPVVIVDPPGNDPGTTPTPEPGTAMLLMGGLLIAIGMKRWRQ